MPKSQVFFLFCLSFIGGIFLNSFLSIRNYFVLTTVFVIFGILLISIFWGRQKFVILGFCFLFFAFGICRHEAAELKIAGSELKKHNDSGQEISFAGRIVKEPEARENNARLTIKPENMISDKGKILVIAEKYPEYQYGDRLRITGKLQRPAEDIDGFNYQDYLAKDGVYSVIYWSKIELLERKKENIYAKILEFKGKMRKSIRQNLSYPQSSILSAMILGDKGQIPNDLKQSLNLAGVRHITAISGMHITILTCILMAFLLGFGLWRWQAFYFSIALMVLFIIMTGLQPSAVRAGIMGGLFLLSQYLGRTNASSRTMFFAAAGMLAANPLLLKLDAGFQLSFLAIMGIIHLGPVFSHWLKFIPEEKFINLKGILIMTFSAQVFTLPILIYNFGYVSLVSPLANIFIVPLLSLIMLSGFIFSLAGIFWQFLGWIFSWPSWLLLTYVAKMVDWFSSFPLAAYFLEIPGYYLVISYLFLGFAAYYLKLSQRQKIGRVARI